MARKTSPLQHNVRIVTAEGNPTGYFLRQWNQQRSVNLSAEELEQIVAGAEIETGGGVQGGGPLLNTDPIELTNTGVDAGTYGNATNVPQLSVDQKGRITGVTNVPITGGGGGALTPPSASAYTVVNGGAGVVLTDAVLGMVLVQDGAAGAGARLAVRAIPAGDFDFIALIQHYFDRSSTNNGSGIVVRNSLTNQFTALERGQGSAVANEDISTVIRNYNNSFTSPTLASSGVEDTGADDSWFRVQRVGTTLNFYRGMLGGAWVLLYSASEASFTGTIDQIGYICLYANIVTSRTFCGVGALHENVT